MDINDLLDIKLDLRKLIDSGLTTLSDLAKKELIGLANLDPVKNDLDQLTSQYAFGATTRIYYGRSDGTFDPGVDLSPDKFITRSIAIGDVDGDGHPDIVVGNVGTGVRLYKNLSTTPGTRGFDTGTTVTEPGPLTQAVVLADMDGDHDLDLVVGNLLTPNRLYLNDGHGNFDSGTDISTDANATVGLAVGDVTGDDHPDVVTANSKPAIGAAGAGSAFDVGGEDQAYVASGATVLTDRSLFVTAQDTPHVSVISRAGATSAFGSASLAAASPNIDSSVVAHIDGNVQAALASGLTGPAGVYVTATSNDNLLGHASGNATADEAALAASAVLFRMNTKIDAYVGPKAVVDVENPSATGPLNVEVSAQHNTTGLGVAGSFGGSQFVTAGAALVATLANKDVSARLQGANVHAQNDVLVNAASSEDVDSLSAGVAQGWR